MRKIIFFDLLVFYCTVTAAQSPQTFNYQGIARNSQGDRLTNQLINLRFSILQSFVTGSIVYSEKQNVTTNNFGLFTVAIGSGTVISGKFSDIDWGNGTKFLKVEIDPLGGNNFILEGVTQFLSVPYALFAEKTTLLAGTGINISNGNTIAAAYKAGNGITINGDTISSTQVQAPVIETKLIAGNNTEVLGNGTPDDPYIINAVADSGRSQNFDQVLQTGSYTLRPFSFGLPTNGIKGNITTIYPANYNTVYPGYGKAKEFLVGLEQFDDVNSYNRPNIVGLMWGYNTNVGGGLSDPEETAGFGFRTETDYNLNNDGAAFEFHLPEVTYGNGTGSERLWSFYVYKSTGTAIHQSQCQSFNFNTKNENATYLSWDANTNGGNPAINRNVGMNFSAKGNGQSLLQMTYENNEWASFSITNDRGAVNFIIDPANPNGYKNYNFTGNGVFQSSSLNEQSYLQVKNTNGNNSAFSVFVDNNTWGATSSINFDRRFNGQYNYIENGKNAGEIEWNHSISVIKGISNGTMAIGAQTFSALDLYITQKDIDGNAYDNFIFGRDGNFSVNRGSINTAAPSAIGSGRWKLGKKTTEQPTGEAANIEIEIDGVTYILSAKVK